MRASVGNTSDRDVVLALDDVHRIFGLGEPDARTRQRPLYRLAVDCRARRRLTRRRYSLYRRHL